MRNNPLKFCIFIVCLFLIFSSCNNEEPEPDNSGNSVKYSASRVEEFMLFLMDEIYLWRNQTPDADPSDYENPQALLDELKNKPIDKWSFVIDTASYNKVFKDGQGQGFGFNIMRDFYGDLRVSFVYNKSPMGRAGIERSYYVKEVAGLKSENSTMEMIKSRLNDPDRNAIRFKFKNPENNNTIDTIISKGPIDINTVLHKSVHNIEGTKLGYLVYNSFSENSINELDQAFSYFQSKNINELVLDLRYNGGGRLTVAKHLADLIAGKNREGKKLATLRYNNKYSNQYDTTYRLSSKPNSFNFYRIFVITTRQTASSSELMITSLSPYIDVLQIGNYTSGKPVGMNGFNVNRDNIKLSHIIFPVTFKYVNKNGFTNFYNGLKPDVRQLDDLSHAFGNPAEASLHEAVYYIKNGSFSSQISRKGDLGQQRPMPLKGFRQRAGYF